MTDRLNNMWKELISNLQNQASSGMALAFSGGVDSSLLAVAAQEARISPLLAVTFSTEMTSRENLALASRIAEMLKLDHITLTTSMLDLPAVSSNRPDRCYSCKLTMFRLLRNAAQERGITMLADGSNAEDMAQFRPGNQAARELGVVHPLAAAGLKKEDIRALARMHGLVNWDLPASPCLATRFPYDTMLSCHGLARVATSEQFLHRLGFREVRLRVHNELARIEAPATDLPRLLGYRDEITAFLRGQGFNFITLDLDGLTSGVFDQRR